MGSACLIRTENLCFERDEIKVIDRVNLELNSGDLLQVEGCNGSGKTTLLRLLTTAIKPTSGRIFYQGKKLSDCRYEYCSNIIFIGHQIALKERLTPVENLNWLSPIGLSQDSINRALDLVGLRDFATAPSWSLSAGQKRRVALARLIVSNAKIWFLDEPFTAIDTQGIGLMRQLIDDHVSKGGAVVFSTHQSVDMKNVRRYSLK
ncbi:MAG: cytochrome c biogenesis heme-transporting ATPase CcmA [Porticoccaceae bacterium]|nr:cytochrome c biogenesis heme-transporting ATPase CcmA [Porticoccaceae bacterium]